MTRADPSLIFAQPTWGITINSWLVILAACCIAGAILLAVFWKKKAARLSIVLVMCSVFGLSGYGAESQLQAAKHMRIAIQNEADLKMRAVDLLRTPAELRDQPHPISFTRSDGTKIERTVSFNRATGEAILEEEKGR